MKTLLIPFENSPSANLENERGQRELPSRPPDLCLAFVPPKSDLKKAFKDILSKWPRALIVGSEAVTQFCSNRLITLGCLKAFWWSQPVTPQILSVCLNQDAGVSEIDRVIDQLKENLKENTVYLYLADGLDFPSDRFVPRLHAIFQDKKSVLLGGLASQPLDEHKHCSRVFIGTGYLPSSCLLVELPHVDIVYTVLSGWDPASPIYQVTRAEGRILYEIEGEPAVSWFKRFFTLEDGLAPMPETAYQFPIIVVGPKQHRKNLYRSLREFNNPPGAVTLWGDIETGDFIRLGIGNGVTLVRKALKIMEKHQPESILLFSCVGREVVLGGYAERELLEFSKHLREIPITGLFTFGEVGHQEDGTLVFFNQTAVVIGLKEVLHG